MPAKKAKEKKAGTQEHSDQVTWANNITDLETCLVDKLDGGDKCSAERANEVAKYMYISGGAKFFIIVQLEVARAETDDLKRKISQLKNQDCNKVYLHLHSY